MNKPLWAFAAIALFGTAGVAGALAVASSGGEEAALLQEPTPSRTPCPTGAPDYPDPRVTPSPLPCLGLPGPQPGKDCIDGNGDGVCTGPPDYPIESAEVRTTPSADTALFLHLQGRRHSGRLRARELVRSPGGMRAHPVARSRCVPAAECSTFGRNPRGPSGIPWGPCAGGFHQIGRGQSVVRWGTELCGFYVAPEDEVDFRGLRELFLPGGATPPPQPNPTTLTHP